MTELAPVTLVPGMDLYKYRLVSRIGHGSFGEVWRAHDLAVQREYAIKILRPGVPLDDRLREAQIGNRLEHDNLVNVHQADVVSIAGEETVILAMDYHPSGSVETLSNPANYLPLPDVLRIAQDILRSLEHLHARNFYHNDIKPGNILLRELSDGQYRAMLSDYGITGVSSNGAPVAAPSSYIIHLAPEVLTTGSIGVSSDIFQVGMTLARLLIDLDHFGAIRSRIGTKRYEQYVAAGKLLTQRDFGSHIPASVRQLILKAIHPDPNNRYSSALEMRRELEKKKMCFLGYWTVCEDDNKNKKEVGRNGKYEYFYSTPETAKKKFDVTCSRRNVESRAVANRVRRFCKRDLTRSEADKLITKFKQFVVTGR